MEASITITKHRGLHIREPAADIYKPSPNPDTEQDANTFIQGLYPDPIGIKLPCQKAHGYTGPTNFIVECVKQ